MHSATATVIATATVAVHRTRRHVGARLGEVGFQHVLAVPFHDGHVEDEPPAPMAVSGVGVVVGG
ncbi:MAG: hypothetical protein ABEJ68_01190 [Halobacteriaceae archaeon]